VSVPTSQLVILDLSGQPRLGFKGRGTLAAMQKRGIVVEKQPNRAFPQTEHVHFYGFYIGNFPDLGIDEVDALCAILNSV